MPETTTNPELAQNTIIICVGGHAINSANFGGYVIEKSIPYEEEHFVYRIIARGSVGSSFKDETICAVGCSDFHTDNEALEIVIEILTELLQVLNDDDFEIWNVNDHSYFGGG